MCKPNPYYTKGTHDGISYIEREADLQLYNGILKNVCPHYFLAPRQSGKSSLIFNVKKKLDPSKFNPVFIDISALPAMYPESMESISAFSKAFCYKLRDSLNIFDKGKSAEGILFVLRDILANLPKRIIIFIDEVDRLADTKFKDDFFGTIRSIHHLRREESRFNNVQFILSGALPKESLISKPHVSPFNIAESIELKDLPLDKVIELSKFLREQPWKVSNDLEPLIYGYTGGSVYLTQLVLERLWDFAESFELQEINENSVEKVVQDIISKSPDDGVHFATIHSYITNKPDALEAFQNMVIGRRLSKTHTDFLKLAGITTDGSTYRNKIYEKVFGANGPLSLVYKYTFDEQRAKDAKDRYLETGNIDDLDEAVASWERIINHPEFSNEEEVKLSHVLNHSASTYFLRYQVTGVIEDLDQALSYWSKLSAIISDSSLLSYCLNNLGNALRSRYTRTGELKDLEASIEAFQNAIRHIPEERPEFARLLNNLGNVVHNRYKHTGNIRDLKDAVSVYQMATDRTHQNSPELPRFLSDVGYGLHDRYARSGELDDLDGAISAYQKAIRLIPDNSPELPRYLNNYGKGLYDRYARTGELKNLQDAINIFRQAVNQTPVHSPDLPNRLNMLSTGLLTRYTRTDELNYLEEAISAVEKAVNLSPNNTPDLPKFLNNLGNALKERYTKTSNLKDLKDAIVTYEKAIRLTPENAPDLPRCLLSLGNGLKDQYSSIGDMKDLENAIVVYEKAIRLTPDNAPDLPRYLLGFGDGLKERYTAGGDPNDLYHATNAYRKAAKLGLDLAIEVGLETARNWMRWAFSRQDWKGVEEAYGYAYQASERLLRLQLLRHDKEIWLKATQGMAAQAAYALAQNNRLQSAVIALENSLARLLSESLEQDYSHLKSFEGVQMAAKEVPLVYILTSEAGGMALIVQDTINLVWLPELTERALEEIVIGKEKGVSSSYIGSYLDMKGKYSNESRNDWFAVLEKITNWLWQVLMIPLLRELHSYSKVVFIPVGLLNILPLHTAWTEYPNAATGKQYVFDNLTISYAPNAQSLIASRNISNQISDDILLAVNAIDKFPNSQHEVETIISYFDRYKLLSDESATCPTFLDSLKNATIIHFSGYGDADLDNPLYSMLKMTKDEYLSLEDILKLRLKIRLATLSTSESGIPGIKLPDEVISLATGFLQAGTAGVISSLWNVPDSSTMMLMIRFYDYWRQKMLEPPEALRLAQIWVRDSTNSEKIGYFRELKKNKKFSGKAMKRIYTILGFSDPNARDFAHPYYWAAFTYIGV